MGSGYRPVSTGQLQQDTAAAFDALAASIEVEMLRLERDILQVLVQLQAAELDRLKCERGREGCSGG